MSTLQQKKQLYASLCHAMQTGVAFRDNKSDQKPKHLRVGVNSAMVETGVLAKILIDKGIVTEEEHLDALIEGMRKEVDAYRQYIADEKGVSVDKIQLG